MDSKRLQNPGRFRGGACHGSSAVPAWQILQHRSSFQGLQPGPESAAAELAATPIGEKVKRPVQ